MGAAEGAGVVKLDEPRGMNSGLLGLGEKSVMFIMYGDWPKKSDSRGVAVQSWSTPELHGLYSEPRGVADQAVASHTGRLSALSLFELSLLTASLTTVRAWESAKLERKM